MNPLLNVATATPESKAPESRSQFGLTAPASAFAANPKCSRPKAMPSSVPRFPFYRVTHPVTRKGTFFSFLRLLSC